MKTLHKWLNEERGRTTRLAKHLGLSQPFVHKMGSGAKQIPVAHGAAIETFTNGEVSRKDMFPNWQHYWPELAATATNSKQKQPAALTNQAQSATHSEAA